MLHPVHRVTSFSVVGTYTLSVAFADGTEQHLDFKPVLAGLLGALLFSVVAVQIFMGGALTPLSKPLPFFAYPFLAATLLGWAWVHYRDAA